MAKVNFMASDSRVPVKPDVGRGGVWVLYQGAALHTEREREE